MKVNRWLLAVFFASVILIAVASFVTWRMFLSLAEEDDEVNIRVATTTSTENSGLLDFLLPKFYETSNVRVSAIAVGTGAALEMGQRGDADCIIVHARDKEDAFVAGGWGVHRVDLMYNDFIIVGPEDDPANITGLANITVVLSRILETESNWLSRGDNSGTHSKELKLWENLGFVPAPQDQSWNAENSWYEETGLGMGNTLTIADQKNAYVLTDRGTWIFRRDSLPQLKLLAEGDSALHNPYGTLLINPKIVSNVNFEAAREFIKWLISNEGQALIDSYTVQGDQLFHSDFENHIDEMTSEEKSFWGISNS
ncbi:MAG: substrate-binding domain-containing protein [Candidatus Hodarchaeales archaeon]|jgi:tungstate transport system substrate-binding protein